MATLAEKLAMAETLGLSMPLRFSPCIGVGLSLGLVAGACMG